MRDKGKTKKKLSSEPREMHQSSESKVDIDLEKEKFRLVVELVPNAILMVNQKGEFILVNSQAEKLFGYNREELIGQTVEILVPERFRSKHSEYSKSFFVKPPASLIGI